MSKDRKRPNSVFRIMVMMFIIVIVLIYLLSSLLYRSGYMMTTNKITQSLVDRSDVMIENLEKEIQGIKDLQVESLHNEDFMYYANASRIMRKYEQFFALGQIEDRIDLIADSSSLIEDVSLWFTNETLMVSSTNGIVANDLGWIRLYNSSTRPGFSNISVVDQELYMLGAFPSEAVSETMKPLYILAVKLSKEELVNELLKFNTHPNFQIGIDLLGQDYHLNVVTDDSMAVQDYVEIFGDETKIQHQKQSDDYIVTDVASSSLGMNLSLLVPKTSIHDELTHYQDLFIFFSVSVILLLVLYLIRSRSLINVPLKRLVNALSAVESGDLSVKIEHDSDDEFDYVYSSFNNMSSSLKRMIDENYRQKLLTNEAELKQLQAQINPHFLHNSFYIMYRMAQDEDYETLKIFLIHLSDYYRYITQSEDVTDLKSEIEHAYKYAKIQALRFRNRISIDFDEFPKTYNNIRVPRLIIQPLLENAFEHGLKDTLAGGYLKIHFEEQDHILQIQVEDNGSGIDSQTLANIHSQMSRASNEKVDSNALVNIHSRLRVWFGEDAGISIQARSDKGTIVTLSIPVVSPSIEMPVEEVV